MKIPPPLHSTAAAIFAAYEAKADDGLRAHHGCSEVGGECERAGWYSFHWALPSKFEGRTLRLFETGKREEARVFQNLRMIGCKVKGQRTQIRVSALGGHLGGSLDGIVSRLPEAPKTPHVLEIKTHSAKSFADLCKKGVKESKPQHYAQMQLYCGLAGLSRWMYFAVNKDDDALHIERGEFNREAFDALMAKAERVITAAEPPARINDDPEWWQCKLCRFRPVCHGDQVPLANCRTCLHSTASIGPPAPGLWHCARFGEWNDAAGHMGECPEHRYIPALLGNIAELVDADAERNIVFYRKRDGTELINDRAGI